MKSCGQERLLIVADDFTGALDTGIQFVKKGIPVQVVAGWEYDFSKADSEISVFVVDTESRPVSKEEAYRRVYEVTRRAKEAGFTYFYKKTDSALRGNIGSEILGMMNGCGETSLMMIPAFPKVRRLTKEGIHYIDGVPVADSVFGKDPFEPVRYSRVEEILHSQVEISVESVGEPDRFNGKFQKGKVQIEKHEPGEFHTELFEPEQLRGSAEKIFVFDVSSEESLEELVEFLKKEDAYRLCSGCAGFAAYYYKLLNFPVREEKKLITGKKLLCLSGSVNPITIRQIQYAKAHGFAGENLPCYKKLSLEYYRSEAGQKELDALFERMQMSGRYVIDTLDMPGEESVEEYAVRAGLSEKEIRERIAGTLGFVGWEMVKRGFDGAISVTGGDTLMGFMEESNCKELLPLAEIGQGAVLSEACWDDRRVPVISKSGGFGEEDIFAEIAATLE